MRSLLVYALLAIVLLWLVLSYLPAGLITLPQIEAPRSADWLLRALGGATVALFVMLHLWLVRSTDRAVKQTQSGFRLGRVAELVWTALPLGMALLLAWASLPIWRSMGS